MSIVPQSRVVSSENHASFLPSAGREEIQGVAHTAAQLSATLSIASLTQMVARGGFRPPSLWFAGITGFVAISLKGISAVTDASEGEGFRDFLMMGVTGFLGGVLARPLLHGYSRYLLTSFGRHLGEGLRMRLVDVVATSLLSHVGMTAAQSLMALREGTDVAWRHFEEAALTLKGLTLGTLEMASFHYGKGYARRWLGGRANDALIWFAGTFAALTPFELIPAISGQGFSLEAWRIGLSRTLDRSYKLAAFDLGTAAVGRVVSSSRRFSRETILPYAAYAGSAALVGIGLATRSPGLAVAGLPPFLMALGRGRTIIDPTEIREKALTLGSLAGTIFSSIETGTAGGIETALACLTTFRQMTSQLAPEFIAPVDRALEGTARALYRNVQLAERRKKDPFPLPPLMGQHLRALIQASDGPRGQYLAEILAQLSLIQTSRDQAVTHRQFAYVTLRAFCQSPIAAVAQAIAEISTRDLQFQEAFERLMGEMAADARVAMAIGVLRQASPGGNGDPSAVIPPGWPDAHYAEVAWHLYDQFRRSWPILAGESAPSPTIAWFAVRYGGEGGLRQFKEGLGQLTLHASLSVLWYGPPSAGTYHELRRFLREEPRLERDAWEQIGDQMPAWFRGGFDPGQVIDSLTEVRRTPPTTTAERAANTLLMVRRTALMAASRSLLRDLLRRHSLQAERQLEQTERALRYQLVKTTLHCLALEVYRLTNAEEYAARTHDQAYETALEALRVSLDEAFPLADLRPANQARAAELEARVLARVRGGSLELSGTRGSSETRGLAEREKVWPLAQLLRQILSDPGTQARVEEVRVALTRRWIERNFDQFWKGYQFPRMRDPVERAINQVVAVAQFLANHTPLYRPSEGAGWERLDSLNAQALEMVLDLVGQKMEPHFRAAVSSPYVAETAQRALWHNQQDRRLRDAVLNPIADSLARYQAKQALPLEGAEQQRIDSIVTRLRLTLQQMRQLCRLRPDRRT